MSNPTEPIAIPESVDEVEVRELAKTFVQLNKLEAQLTANGSRPSQETLDELRVTRRTIGTILYSYTLSGDPRFSSNGNGNGRGH